MSDPFTAAEDARGRNHRGCCPDGDGVHAITATTLADFEMLHAHHLDTIFRLQAALRAALEVNKTLVTERDDLLITGKVRLRDTFAAAALTGLLANRHFSPVPVSTQAFEHADAMIKARQCPAPSNA